MKFKNLPITVEPIEEDEHLYSIYIKAQFMHGIPNTKFRDLTIGKGRQFPTPFGQILLSAFEPFEEAINHTDLKYRRPSLSEEDYGKVVESFRDGKRYTYRSALIPESTKIKYCDACLIEDTEKHGAPFYHTEHQLEGFCCTRHGTKLRSLNGSHTNPGNFLLYSDLYRKPEMADQRLVEACRLLGEITDFDLDTLKRAYKRLFEEKGYKKGTMYNDWERVYADLTDFYGVELLEEAGATVSQSSNWIKNIFLKRETKVPVLFHLLLWHCYGLTKEKVYKLLKEKEEGQVCRMCDGKLKFLGETHQKASYYKCRDCETVYCGKQLFQPGERIVREIQEKYRSGVTVEELREKTGLSERRVREIIEGENLRPFDKRIEKAAADAIKSKEKSDSREYFRKNFGNSYSWLVRFYPEKLNEIFPRKKPGKRPDLTEKDKMLKERIIKDLERLREEGRITITSLIKKGYLPSKFNPDRYPVTALYLEGILEDNDTYYRKKVKKVIDQALEDQVQLTAYKISEKYNINRKLFKKYLPDFKDYIKERSEMLYACLFFRE